MLRGRHSGHSGKLTESILDPLNTSNVDKNKMKGRPFKLVHMYIMLVTFSCFKIQDSGVMLRLKKVSKEMFFSIF